MMSKKVPDWRIKLYVSLTASLIAFSVSLFVAEISKHNKKVATAQRIALVTLSNIDELANNLEIVTVYYDEFRRMYDEIKENYSNLESVPDSLCDEFVDYLEGWDIFAINKSPELTFCTTFELWDYLDNVPLIRRIGNCYAYENAFLELYNRDQAIISELAASAGLSKGIDNHEKLKNIMSSTPFSNYMKRSEAISFSYHSILEKIRLSNELNKKVMDVTDDELNTLVAPQHWANTKNEDFIFVVGPDM